MSDRKYRQRGYQDDDGRGRERSRAGAPSPRREGPRGRGLGAPSREVFRCAACGAVQMAPEASEVSAVCEACGADLHSCTHCTHFDTSVHHECRREVPVRIANKGKRNSCELFAPRRSVEHAAERADPADPRAAFDALFKI